MRCLSVCVWLLAVHVRVLQASESATCFLVVGDASAGDNNGYCSGNFKWLTSSSASTYPLPDETHASCHALVLADDDCVNKEEFSFGSGDRSKSESPNTRE